MFIDIHTHAFHPKIAAKAIEQVNNAYTITCRGNGTIVQLLERERAAGVDKCVLLCAATVPEQVVPANNYAITLQKKHPEVIAFGAMHPGCTHWEAELERIAAAGIRGIKLHADFQNFRLDDKRLLPIFDYAQNKFIFILHIGSAQRPAAAPSCPYKVAAILDAFPGLAVIAAHLGGYRMWAHALKVFTGRRRENLWFDTSSVTPCAPPRLFQTLVNAYPPERLLFGSDWPLFDPVDELERLSVKAALSQTAIERLLGNAAALLGL